MSTYRSYKEATLLKSKGRGNSPDEQSDKESERVLPDKDCFISYYYYY